MHNSLGRVYYARGQHEAAAAAYRQAMALDPTDDWLYKNLGLMYCTLQQYDEAIAAYQEAIRIDPTNAFLHNELGNIYSVLDRNEEARTAYERDIELDASSYQSMGGLARLERQSGNQAQTAMWLSRMRTVLAADDCYNLACLESIAGNADAAVAALKIALERQESTIEWARDDPDFVFIRDDPRYRALLGLVD
jgi:tetratricopeptide (TPR) repeat protein